MSENPKVFISYSHESADFEEKVLEFSNRLRSEGIDASITFMKKHLLRVGHAGWKTRSEKPTMFWCCAASLTTINFTPTKKVKA